MPPKSPPIPLARQKLTDYLIEQISQVVTVGDAEAPRDGGWDGSPDKSGSTYAAYVVLTPSTAGDATGPIGDSIGDMHVPYVITGYGVTRGQVEGYMDAVRQVVVATSRRMVVLGESTWKVQQARCDSLGGISRNDTVEPSEFSQTDVYMFYISKEL